MVVLLVVVILCVVGAALALVALVLPRPEGAADEEGGEKGEGGDEVVSQSCPTPRMTSIAASNSTASATLTAFGVSSGANIGSRASNAGPKP